ncbi:aminotransferase class I/II-fold pyridoxal phosphate-dependent enzyme [Neorhizobium sp. DAR64860/K0K1]|uniref:aminotransferase class I/II-fold pyridoxal phosphate-dependent enzyme n=1 Tax=Neorhizobium sp. DAR64860/K0K1 TaxID=3421955 RepID=UPI003D2AC1CE
MPNLTQHRFRNTSKLAAMSSDSWDAAKKEQLISLYVDSSDVGHIRDTDDGPTEFINMSCYSYLGLNRHSQVIEGAIDALRHEGITSLGIAPTRIRSNLVKRTEEGLSDLFDAKCLVSLSCSVATSGLLPLISSGHLANGGPRVTVFDKKAHFCMDWIKPICADEAPVISAPHNDMDFLEDVCRRNQSVAYIADGAYSLGGTANLDALLSLQDRYGLFVWFDDSHSLSVAGRNGEGMVRSHMGELNPLTVISASLDKGFGCSGGVVMFDREFDTSFVNTFAGPMCWSQSLNTPSLGSILASTEIHASSELQELQTKLRQNIAYFDEMVPTELTGSLLPIRSIHVGDASLTIALSRLILENGFYCAASYFPITARGREGLRVMLRADHRPEDLVRFCTLLRNEVLPRVRVL